MAINAYRPDGASQFNRFLGTVVQAVGPDTASGEVPAAAAVPGVVTVAFGPLDVPKTVLDDNGWPFGTLGAGLGPHSNVDLRSWAQNAKVLCKPAGAEITDAVLAAQAWTIDPSTDLPILHLDLTLTALPAGIDVWVEVTHSKVR
jgi:hypothetical protein